MMASFRPSRLICRGLVGELRIKTAPKIKGPLKRPLFVNIGSVNIHQFGRCQPFANLMSQYGVDHLHKAVVIVGRSASPLSAGSKVHEKIPFPVASSLYNSSISFVA